MVETTRIITFANLGGGDVTQGIIKILSHMPKNARMAVVEFPCLGTPRLGYALSAENIARLSKEQTIDQLLLDYERKSPKSMNHYMMQHAGVDYLLINPRSLPETPVIRKLQSNQTLIELPIYLRKQLANYEFVFFVTQGTLVHPTTHFSIRCADATILYSADAVDFVGNFTHFKKLQEIFGVEAERLLLFSADPHLKLDEAEVFTKLPELAKQISRVSSKEITIHTGRYNESEKKEVVGLIEPLEYLHYQAQLSPHTTEFSKTDSKKLNDLTNLIRSRLQQNHMDDYINSLTNEAARQKIRYLISDYVREQIEYTFNMKINDLVEWVQKEITELGVIQEILDDPTISSIEINGPDQVIVEQDGRDVHRQDVRFNSARHYHEVINKILMPIGKPISSTEPIVDANYRGFRICVVADTSEYQGISAKYPLVSIRKFPPAVYTDEECIRYGNLSREIIDFLKFIVPKGANIIISGGTNSGKTAQLIRLPLRVDPMTRIISIEDSEEMMLASKEQYKHYPNLPSLLVKEVEDEKKSYGIDRLIKACLRLKPTVMCIGEIRDEAAAKQSLIGMNTGHTVWTTIHANSAKEAATRFLQLNGNTVAAASQIASSIDIILFQKKLPDGRRTVTEISEVLGYNGTEEPILNPIFKYNYQTKRHERVGYIRSESLLEKIYLKDPEVDEIARWCEGRKELSVI
ncbi:ATPase, T2SS/T4P/T4SS family [Paenibacillus macerans]|uniref:Type II/IV secretion system family protein n=1 Tax=Paenibacillus macerans TaxID=44252 RepID=A0A090YLF9_PAEMA|nr:ATPase, T2SS/T4P/T4SS family [Paenibacillus macerans]KFM92995.1 type II/IV secretion system family protein [Paenibacillus macerans]MCY7558554.1 Flp pilus assembly complex ATPase component TadA [Paenibacillus macerans]MEC0153938.1 ATPase, T2SS/T4P/T4SS family [Paenibacillus macerans]SUA84790.1 type II secretion system protein E [Paenibacillus macerans]